MKGLKIALIQMKVIAHEVEQNLKHAAALVKDAVKKGAKLIVLPELFDSGYFANEKDKDFSINFDKAEANKSFQTLSKIAQKNEVYIVASSIERDKESFFNTAYIISPKGKILGKQRKIYLWENEKDYFKPGEKQKVFTLKFDDISVKVGLGVCYEIGFNEIARTLALKGAQILIYPGAFSKTKTYVWDLSSRARALENGVYVLACNRSGEELNLGHNVEFAGHSCVVSPRGDVVAGAKKDDEVLFCELDMNLVSRQRKNLPYLKDLSQYNEDHLHIMRRIKKSIVKENKWTKEDELRAEKKKRKKPVKTSPEL